MNFRRIRAMGLAALVFSAWGVSHAPAGEAGPFLLWTRAEAAALRKHILANDWAQEKVQAMVRAAESPAQRRTIDNLFLYAVLGEKSVVEAETAPLIDFIGSAPYKVDPFHWMWHHVDRYQHVLRYDVLQDELAPHQRRALDITFRRIAIHGIKEERIREWEAYPRMASASLCALITRDERLIRGIFECKGGLREYLDQLVDGHFSRRAGNPVHKYLGHLMLWCRGCERLGLDELGFGYVSENGGSVRAYLAGIFKVADPQLTIPGGMPFYGRSAMAELFQPGGMGFRLPEHPYLGDLAVAPIVMGRGPDGGGGWPAWSPGGAGEKVYRTFEQGGARMHLRAVFELAHRRWPDGPFGYFLTRMRDRGEDIYYPTVYWGLNPIDAEDVSAPAAKSEMFLERGLAILRAEQGRDYWTSSAPMASLRTGVAGRRGSGAGCFAIQSLFALNRPIYLSPRPVGRFDRRRTWADSARSRCTVAVDNLQMGKAVRDRKYVEVTLWPRPVGKTPTRHRFDELAQFVGVRAAPETYQRPGPGETTITETAGLYPWLRTERCLVLTREYLFDVFHLAGKREHTYHWLVHAIGQAAPDDPQAWKPTDDLTEELAGPRGIDFEKGRLRDVGGETWSLTAEQSCFAKDPADSRLGAPWYARKVAVRVTVLGEPGTKAYFARTRGTVVRQRQGKRRKPQPEDKYDLPDRSRDYDQADHGVTEITIPPAGQTAPPDPPEPEKPEPPPPPEVVAVRETGGVSIIARRRCEETTFAAIHEPFERRRRKVEAFRRIQQTPDAIGVAVTGRAAGIEDRILLRLGEQAGEPITLAGGGESFTFTGYAFVRVAEDAVRASGDLRAMKVRVIGTPRLRVNGKRQEALLKDGLLTWKGLE